MKAINMVSGNKYIPTVTRFSGLLALMLAVSMRVIAQGVISGQPSPALNTTYTYSYVHTSITTSATWSSSGATITNVRTSTDKLTAYADIKWTTAGTKTIALKIGSTVIANKTVSITSGGGGGTLPTPSFAVFVINNGVQVRSNQNCGPTTFKIVATPGSGANTVRWYTSATGGTVFFNGNDYTTPLLTENATYYISSYNMAPDARMAAVAAAPSESARVPVTLLVGALVSTPLNPTGGALCGNGPITLTANAGANGNVVRWYESLTATTVLASGNSYIAAFSGNKTFYVESYNSDTKCFSPRVPVNASINPLPDQPIGISDDIIKGSGQTTITLSPGQNADQVRWYLAGPEGDFPFFTGNEFTTPVLSTTTMYSVDSYNSITACKSQRKQIEVLVKSYISPFSIKSEYIRVAGVKSDLGVSQLTAASKNTVLSYFDGLGRRNQQVMVQRSPLGKDVVVPVEFDTQGRESRTYLPYISATTNGQQALSYEYDQKQFYSSQDDKIADESKPYSEARFEPSPLGRIVERGGIGTELQLGGGHTVSMHYSYNTGSITSPEDVRRFNADGTSTEFYAANQLSRTMSIDGEGHQVISFSDNAGHTLVKKEYINKLIDGVHVEYLETYYIYDDLGNLNYIINPKGVSLLHGNGWIFNETIRNEFTHQFAYDRLGRVVFKKTPGQAAGVLVYDRYGRPVFSQDALLKAEHKWLFTRYDRKGRPVMQGLYTNTSLLSQADMQVFVDGLYTPQHASFPETAFGETRGNTLHGYSSVTFPKANGDESPLEVLAVNYYDSYDFDDGDDQPDFQYMPQGLDGESTQQQGSPRLLATGSKQRVVGTDTWLYTYMFYDDRGRVIQTRSNNHLSSIADNLITRVLDFEGKVLAVKNDHHAGNGRNTIVINRYQYDTGGRLEDIYQKNNNNTDQLVAHYEYNELGQLVDKKLHDKGQGNFMQSVDLRYTIEGQLASINNAQLNNDNNLTNDDSDDYFGLELLYTRQDNALGNTSFYNGNISAVKWKGPTEQKSYVFSYDKTNKLEKALSKQFSGAGWTQEQNVQNEEVTYDLNGNITTLTRNQRSRDVAGNVVAQLLDNLTYTYAEESGDKLIKVEDNASAVGMGDFKNGVSEDIEYTYDANGNQTADRNKGIASMHYNFMGKVSEVVFDDGRRISYTYAADGSKLTTQYFQGTSLQRTTDYVNGFVYEAEVLSHFGSPEGRVVNKNGALEFEYAIADHQGNTRVVFTAAEQQAKTVDVDFESETEEEVDNYPTGGQRSGWNLFNHTAGGTSSQLLNGGHNGQVGITKSFEVYPGDKVKIEAYAKYYNTQNTATDLTGFATALASAFGVSPASTGSEALKYNSLSNIGGLSDMGVPLDESLPKLFVNILVFDKDYNLLDVAYRQVSGGEQQGVTPKTDHNYIFQDYNITEPGYALLYISNENPTYVEGYFDDVAFSHTPGNIIQYNEYYPFGLQANTSWTREDSRNENLYNHGTELNATSGFYETTFRGYDPALGRFAQVDPLAVETHYMSGYQYANNSPVLMSDPLGLKAYMDITIYNDAPDFSRIGPGSGGHWADGILNSDWTANGGSQMFRDGVKAGLTNIGGKLYHIGPNGVRIEAVDVLGELTIPVTTTTRIYYDGVADLTSTRSRTDFMSISEVIALGLLQAQVGKSVEDIFRALYNHPIGDIMDDFLTNLDPKLEKATGYDMKRVDGGITLEIGRIKRGIINAIPDAPRISSGNPMIHIEQALWPDNKTSVIHIWSSDIQISFEDGYVPLNIYINNNGYKTIDNKNNNLFYPFFDRGKWTTPNVAQKK